MGRRYQLGLDWPDPGLSAEGIQGLATTPAEDLLEAVEVNRALNGGPAEGPDRQIADRNRG